MSMKQFNVKQAERWLQKLKTENLQSYKDVTKFLRKYERTDDEHDCYLKISHTLLAHIELTRELNSFLEDGNKFVVTRGEDEKLREFMNYVRKNRPEMFEQIITMTSELSKSKGEGNTQVSKLIIPKLNEIVKGDPEMEQLTVETFNMNDDELIRKKNIEHLVVNRVGPLPIEDHKDNQPSESVMTSVKKPQSSEMKINVYPPQEERKDRIEKPLKEIKTPVLGFTNSGEEKAALKQIEKSLDPKTYKVLTKIVRIYYLNLITKNEAFDLLAGFQLEEAQFQNLKDILDSREMDRRKISFFRPLSDINFSHYERASPSYVTVPFFYPVKCSGKTAESRALTNAKWISVPYGSEQSENFSVRNKNTHEINLLKAEDERYEYDLYMKRLTKTKELLDRYLQSADSETIDGHMLIRKAVNLGIIQSVYKYCKDDQKEQFQWYLNNHPKETCTLFRDKLANEIVQMSNVRQIHAIKNWSEIATKNFYKALDLKGFEFKKNEKDKMRNQYLIHELSERLKILTHGGDIKSNCLSLEEKKNFFTILNSFECSSKNQKCTSRTLPEFETFDLEDQNRRIFYPVIIMAFQNQEICSHLYSFLLFYIDSSIITEGEKYKAKMFLQQFLIGFLKWKPPFRKMISEYYNEEQFSHKLADHSYDFNCNSCFTSYPEPLILRKLFDGDGRRGEEKKGMKITNDEVSKYSYYPRGGEDKSVFYCSEQVYCLIRYLYAIYERLIRVREVAESEEKIKMFDVLFFTSVKMKEGIKFQQNLSLIFGKQAYLFATIYKLFDSLVKSAVVSANCPITNSSFKLAEQEKCEDIYFLLLNRFCLSNALINQKLIRLTHQQQTKVLYVNTLHSYYKTDDLSKDMNKRRNQISRMVELETIDNFQSGGHKKRKTCDYWHSNSQEYVFGSNSFKMVNHGSNADVLVSRARRDKTDKNMSREIKRAFTFHTYTH